MAEKENNIHTVSAVKSVESNKNSAPYTFVNGNILISHKKKCIAMMETGKNMTDIEAAIYMGIISDERAKEIDAQLEGDN